MLPDALTPPGPCSALSRELLNRVGDKWTMLIVGHLAGGPRRFRELQRTVGDVSQRMLTLTLRNLERDGLVTRTAHPTVPPRVDYELTALGRTLLDPVMAVVRWAESHRGEVQAARSRFEAREGLRPAP